MKCVFVATDEGLNILMSNHFLITFAAVRKCHYEQPGLAVATVLQCRCSLAEVNLRFLPRWTLQARIEPGMIVA